MRMSVKTFTVSPLFCTFVVLEETLMLMSCPTDEYTKRDDHILIPVNVAPDGTMSKSNQDYNAYFVYDADLDSTVSFGLTLHSTDVLTS